MIKRNKQHFYILPAVVMRNIVNLALEALILVLRNKEASLQTMYETCFRCRYHWQLFDYVDKSFHQSKLIKFRGSDIANDQL